MSAGNKTKTKKKFELNQYLRFTKRGARLDLPLLIIVFILLGFGLIMLYSASYVKGIYNFSGDSLHYIKDQLIYASAGLLIMFLASKIDYHVYKRYAPAIMLVSAALLVVVLLMPEINGVNRWIFIKIPGGSITFQPSEISKFAVILMFSVMIENNYDKMYKATYGIFPFAAVLAIVVGLLFLEPHLSAIIITCGIGAIMMFVGGSDIRWFIGAVVAGIALIALVLVVKPDLVSYASSRINAWLHPEQDLQGDGYQSYMSLLAIGSGGLFGLGLGNGRQKQLHLPEPQNDFIFSVICEELGFFGGMVVILLFIALFLRGIYISTHAADKFGSMLTLGIIVQITLQAFLNIAVATCTIPNTGISLPFFSEGGTSLVMILGEIGIVLSVSRYANTDKDE